MKFMGLNAKFGVILALVIAGVVLGSIVSSYIYDGGSTILSFKNLDNNKTYSGPLYAYGDTKPAQCSDTDNGIKPDVNGTTTWTNYDGNVSNGVYSFSDFCLDSNTVVELGCAKNFLVNNVLYPNYMVAMGIKCTDINKTSCNPLAKKCV
jgi:hypothetical protein